LDLCEGQVVRVRHEAPLRRQLGLGGQVYQEDARVDEVLLPLELVRAQVRQQAARRLQEQARAVERNAGAAPEAELAAREVRVVVDRVEAMSRVLAGDARVAVAGR